MLFVVFATDKPGTGELRAATRERHRQYLRDPHSHALTVRLGGPTLAEAADAMNGTLLVVEADSIDVVRAFVAADPYVKAGLFASVEIRPWQWSLGNPDVG